MKSAIVVFHIFPCRIDSVMNCVIIDNALNHVIGGGIRINLLGSKILVPETVGVARQGKVGVVGQRAVDLTDGCQAIRELGFNMRQLLGGLLVQHIKIGS